METNRSANQGSPDKAAETPASADADKLMRQIGGSKCEDWNDVILTQVLNGLWVANSKPDGKQKLIVAAAAGLAGIRPADELEAMIAAQLLSCHNAAMECFRRAMIGEQTFEGRRENLSQANKLTRSFATLLEALNRHRGKGQQKVTVEHVHVHKGGQAIVGAVTTITGGGESPKSKEQPHATGKHTIGALTNKMDDASMPSLWREDSSRDALHVTRDDKRPL